MKSIKTETDTHIFFRNEYDIYHREYGPAIIYKEGFFKYKEEWWFDGKLHREGDLPARYFTNHRIEKAYFIHGNHHRLKDPAII
jgi:hypothetical protein